MSQPIGAPTLSHTLMFCKSSHSRADVARFNLQMHCTKVSRQIAGGTGDADLRHRQKVCTLPTCLSSLFSPKGRRELEISICAYLTRTVYMRALAAYLRALSVAISCIVADKVVGGKLAAHTVPRCDLAPSHCAAGRWLGAGEPGSEAHGGGPCHGGPGGSQQGAASASSQHCAPSTAVACLVLNGLNLTGSIGAKVLAWQGHTVSSTEHSLAGEPGVVSSTRYDVSAPGKAAHQVRPTAQPGVHGSERGEEQRIYVFISTFGVARLQVRAPCG